MIEVMRRHLDEPPPQLRTMAQSVPASLEALIHQMMEKAPDARPTATETRKALNRIAREAPNISTVRSLNAAPTQPIPPLTEPEGRSAAGPTTTPEAPAVAAP